MNRTVLVLVTLLLFLMIPWYCGFFSYLDKSRTFSFGFYDPSRLRDAWEYSEYSTKTDTQNDLVTGVLALMTKKSLFVWSKTGLKRYVKSDSTVLVVRHTCGKLTSEKSPFADKPIVVLNENIKSSEARRKNFRPGDFIVLSVNENNNIAGVDGIIKVDIEVFKNGRNLQRCK